MTVLFEPEPFPEIIMFVPFTEPDGLGVGETEGLPDGDGEDEGSMLGAALPEGAGLPEGLGLVDGFAEAEGLGKLAAAEKVLFKAEALSENNPKTDWLSAKSIKLIRNELKKYVFLIR